jgi:YggT family protein
MLTIISVIQALFQILTLLVLASAVLSFFMSPSHPVRVFVDRLVDPMLMPIRRIVPPVQSMDFSPVILIILLNIVEYFLVSLLNSLR